MQVIDARDPLTYRSSDLEDYARNISRHKGSMLLLNKSDLLPEVRSFSRRCACQHILDAHLDVSATRAPCCC